jgi:hypothetical protein
MAVAPDSLATKDLRDLIMIVLLLQNSVPPPKRSSPECPYDRDAELRGGYFDLEE